MATSVMQALGDTRLLAEGGGGPGRRQYRMPANLLKL
jgi:hypothetical protein